MRDSGNLERIRRRVLELPPGAAISAPELRDTLGLHRDTVKKMLYTLQRDSVVELFSGHGGALMARAARETSREEPPRDETPRDEPRSLAARLDALALELAAVAAELRRLV